MRKAKAATDPFVVTRSQLARLLGTTPDYISKLIQEGLPVVETGGGRGRPTTLDLAAVLPWLLHRSGDVSARETYYLAQTEKLRFDLQIKRGDFIARDEVTRDLQMCARTTVARIRRVPAAAIVAVAAALRAQGEPAAATVMRRYVDEALRELAAKADSQEDEHDAA